MGLFHTFDVAGSALSAQSLRLNLTASNLANMNNVAGDPAEIYRAKHAIFRAAQGSFADRMQAVGVEVLGIVEGNAPRSSATTRAILRPTKQAWFMPQASTRWKKWRT
jgi:flagellar basal-body rod protein FlgC